MKQQNIIHSIVAVLLVLSGCASHPKERPVQERGWIGGRYDRATSRRAVSDWLFGAEHTVYDFPSTLKKSRTAGILTLALGTNTPAYLAGLREGDLVLELGHQSVTNLPGFWRIVTTSKPGGLLAVKAFRDGKMMDYDITVGREKYRDEGSLTIMLPGYVGPLHPIPTQEAPYFSLVALGYEKNNDPPMEFASVKERYKRMCNPKAKHEGYDEDWRWWLAIMEVKKGKKILAQELAPATGTAKP